MNTCTIFLSCTLLTALTLYCTETKLPTQKKSTHQKKTYIDATTKGLPQSSSSSSLHDHSESPRTPIPAKTIVSRSPSPTQQALDLPQTPPSKSNDHYSDDEYDFVEKPPQTSVSDHRFEKSSCTPTFCNTTPSSKMLALIQNPKTDLSDRKIRREIEEGMHKAAQRNDAEQLLLMINTLSERKGEIHDLGSIEAAYATLKRAQQDIEFTTFEMNTAAQKQYNTAHAHFLNNLSRCFLTLYTDLDRIEASRSEEENRLVRQVLNFKAARTNCHTLNPRLASSTNPYVKEGCDSDDDTSKAERYKNEPKLKKTLRPSEFLDVPEFAQRTRLIQKKLPYELTFFPKKGLPF